MNFFPNSGGWWVSTSIPVVPLRHLKENWQRLRWRGFWQFSYSSVLLLWMRPTVT